MDNEFEKVLKVSMLRVSSEDFTDQVMQKIYEEIHDGARITIALVVSLMLLFQLDNLIRLIIDYNKSKSIVDGLKS